MPVDPKPAALRRRRNKVVGAAKLKPGAKRGVPPLPARGERESAWDRRTREWWRTVWSSPMAGIYLSADIPELVRMAGLINQVFEGDAPTFVHQEIRQMADRFGLSPLARRRLQWEVDQAGGSAKVEPAKVEEGRWLRAVSD